jgi:hypothetical protein
LEKFGLVHWVITFVKTKAIIWQLWQQLYILSSNCEPLKILRVYEGTCSRHVMFKACQYGTNDNKVFVGLQHVSVKDALAGLHKTVIWTKKLWKRR